MVIIIALIALAIIFFIFRKHTGPSSLAMIAGVAVYGMSGAGIASWLHNMFNQVPLGIFEHGVYLLFALLAPIILYLRTPKSSSGILFRIFDASICAIIAVSLISTQLAYFFPFDELATTIANFIKTVEGPIVVVGTVFAYLDILFGR